MDKKFIFLTIALLITAAVIFLAYQSQSLKRAYKREVLRGLNRTLRIPGEILTEDDIRHLPEPVQKYIKYVGALGKEKVYSVRAVCEGQVRMDPNGDWVDMHSEQYNFFDEELTRMFYMSATMKGIPGLGLHSYTEETANMHIKLLGLITVLNTSGPEMRIGDTTTLFNDICFFAPAALIDRRISWEPVDATTVKGTLNTGTCKVSATLYFNDTGELVDFVSDDRYYIPLDGSCIKAVWSTPIKGYKEVNGMKVPAYGEAVWKLPEGDYCYGKFSNIKEIEYNSNSFK